MFIIVQFNKTMAQTPWQCCKCKPVFKYPRFWVMTLGGIEIHCSFIIIKSQKLRLREKIKNRDNIYINN
jgi:hypothetical protein